MSLNKAKKNILAVATEIAEIYRTENNLEILNWSIALLPHPKTLEHIARWLMYLKGHN